MSGHAHARAGGRARRGWLRDRRIGTKLAIILVLPLLAILALTAVNVIAAARRAGDAGQARELVALGGTGARLAAALQQERAGAALVFAEASAPAALADYQRRTAAADAAIRQFQAARAATKVPGNLAVLVQRIDGELTALAELRQKVAGSPDAVLSVVAFRYRAVIADVISYRQALGQIGVSAASANGLRSVAALSQAIESVSQLQVAAVRVMAGGRLTPAGQQEIIAADTGSAEALQSFAELGDPTWRGLLNRRIGGGPQILTAERLQGLVTRAQPGSTLDLGTDARGWTSAVGTRIEAMHTVETELDQRLLGAVTAQRDAEQRTVVVSSSVVVALLLAVWLLGLWVARSLAGSLTRLQASALDVANSRLPSMVQRLDADNADRATVERLVAQAADPIPVDGRDEVGQVADAFNTITASAVRIAGEQAALRAGIGAILVSLSRRLQLRMDAMMLSLDALEQDEEDPNRLKQLFDLDHQAVLIRRLIANLQIIAGGRGGRSREGLVPLMDLLRAAWQEIDHYTQVSTGDLDNGVQVSGEVADDVIHLLAELLDNATRSSPPEVSVVVDASHVGDLLHIQIRDQGTGMSEAQLQTVRDRVANPRRLDQRTTQQMGLPVVGSIADRLGIKVDFRSTAQTGTAVDLTVPGALWVYHRPAAAPEAAPELPAVPAVAAVAGPPNWPLPGAHQPAIPAPQSIPAQPVIFDSLMHDPDRSWFRPSPQQPAPVRARIEPVWQPGTGGSPGWAGPTRAVVTVSGPAVTMTPSGLPIRQPGERVIPVTEATTRPSIPVQRVPHQVRRQMSAFQHGLGLAGRRTLHPIAKDDPR